MLAGKKKYQKQCIYFSYFIHRLNCIVSKVDGWKSYAIQDGLNYIMSISNSKETSNSITTIYDLQLTYHLDRSPKSDTGTKLKRSRKLLIFIFVAMMRSQLHYECLSPGKSMKQKLFPKDFGGRKERIEKQNEVVTCTHNKTNTHCTF